MTEQKKTVARKAFEFTKSYETVDIAGKEYKIEFNDEKVLQYTKSFDKFHTETQKIDSVDVKSLTVAKQEELFYTMQGLVKSITEELLGEGTYAELYELSGKSVIGMIDVVMYLSEVVGDRMTQIRDEKKSKYTAKKKV